MSSNRSKTWLRNLRQTAAEGVYVTTISTPDFRALVEIVEAAEAEHAGLHLPSFHPGCQLCIAFKGKQK